MTWPKRKTGRGRGEGGDEEQTKPLSSVDEVFWNMEHLRLEGAQESPAQQYPLYCSVSMALTS